jgi:hypothetical protein
VACGLTFARQGDVLEVAMKHHNRLGTGTLVLGVLGLILTAPSAFAYFDVEGSAVIALCDGTAHTSLTPFNYNHTGSLNFTTLPLSATCVGFSDSASVSVAVDESQSSLSVSGTTSGVGSGGQVNASLGTTLTLTPPPGYTGGPISVGFGSTYSLMLSQIRACVFPPIGPPVCPKNYGLAGIGWAVDYKLNGQGKTLLSAVNLDHPSVEVPANVLLTAPGSKSGIGDTGLISMDCCSANFTTYVGIELANGWSGKANDPLVITVPNGWSYSLAPGPVIPLPEPGTLALLASGFAILAARRGRQRA